MNLSEVQKAILAFADTGQPMAIVAGAGAE